MTAPFKAHSPIIINIVLKQSGYINY